MPTHGRKVINPDHPASKFNRSTNRGGPDEAAITQGIRDYSAAPAHTSEADTTLPLTAARVALRGQIALALDNSQGAWPTLEALLSAADAILDVPGVAAALRQAELFEADVDALSTLDVASLPVARIDRKGERIRPFDAIQMVPNPLAVALLHGVGPDTPEAPK